MGKLDVELLRYLDVTHFRVLTAIEMGMKNHEIVPLHLIASISQIRSGIFKIGKELAKHRLVCYERGRNYDGLRLTNLGYDYLAIKALVSRGQITSFGNQIGTGKESNIYCVRRSAEDTIDENTTDIIDLEKDDSDESEVICLKLHRLGRTCFRNVREKRNYHQNRRQMSWLYLSRISATKEFAYMKALYDRGLPVPKPIDFNRHCVLMELIDGKLLQHMYDIDDPADLYDKLMNLIVSVADKGVIHGDFNEFNIMIKRKIIEETVSDNVSDDSGSEVNEEKAERVELEPIMIDFPQMISIEHRDAEFYFQRDVECVRTFFARRFKYESELFPKFEEIERHDMLDAEISGSGITKQMEKDLLSQLESCQLNEELCDDDCSIDRSSSESDGIVENLVCDQNENAEKLASEHSIDGNHAHKNEADEEKNVYEQTMKFFESKELQSSVDFISYNTNHFRKEDFKHDQDTSPNHEQFPLEEQNIKLPTTQHRSVGTSVCSTIIDPDEVSKRVKASLSKSNVANSRKHMKANKMCKGEASSANRSRMHNREEIKAVQNDSSIWK